MHISYIKWLVVDGGAKGLELGTKVIRTASNFKCLSDIRAEMGINVDIVGPVHYRNVNAKPVRTPKANAKEKKRMKDALSEEGSCKRIRWIGVDEGLGARSNNSH